MNNKSSIHNSFSQNKKKKEKDNASFQIFVSLLEVIGTLQIICNISFLEDALTWS